jgi:N-acetylmuramoyl-L-alanine amidase
MTAGTHSDCRRNNRSGDRSAPGRTGICVKLILPALAAAVVVAAPFVSAPQARSAQPSPAGSKSGDLSLEILDPRVPGTTTTRSHANILGRTAPKAKVQVQDTAAPVFATGIFVRDQLPLNMGENRVRIVATGPDGRKTERTISITRVAETNTAFSLPPEGVQIDSQSVEPARDVFLAEDDVLELAFRGTPGKKAEFRLGKGAWRPMADATDTTSNKAAGLYRAHLALTDAADLPAETVQFRLRDSSGKTAEAASPGKVGYWARTNVRLARVREEGAPLSFGMHEVRLGGPYLAELPAGTVLRVTGMRANNYRVRLSPALDAWISSRDVEWAPPGTPLPHLAFTSISVSPLPAGDQVVIPYPAPVPFSVTPGLSSAGRAAIHIDFYGAHHAATWISHPATAKVLREITAQQIASGHLRIAIELHERQLWGYQWALTNNALRLTVRRPPTLAVAPASPLKGLTVALEAGHGGGNSGARGVSGSLEKDINRMAVEQLARHFQTAGAKTVLVREADEDITLGERTRRAINSGADLFISVHANSAGHDRGYLRVSGTSTYYKWPFNRDLSAAIHSRLLAHTRLPDFGNVGNFNYYPIRANTWMPSMLVEQAFMSNPEDEAKMLDPEFRSEMMRSVVLGTEDWLKQDLFEQFVAFGH